MLDNNRYHILGKLGSGGFGETFLAEDTYMPSRRRCVIKQLKPLINNSQIYQLVQERFQREAAILETLGDSNNQIPKLYAYFEQAGQFYLVQEWIEGETLSEKRFLSESAVKEILVALLPVLDYVHSKGIIHRDIKPDNIILRAFDGKPVLIDFGAVRETMATQVTTGGHTTSSIVIGTPGFMPAEQAAGRPVFSSDLYGLGLTVIYLLTGKMPSELDTDYQTGEILWHNSALEVTLGLKALLDKAIRSHPRDRFPTAKDMLYALQRDTTQEKTEVSLPPSPPSPPPSVPPPQTRSDWQKALIIGATIGLFIIGGLWVLRSQSPEPISQTPTTDPTETVTPIPVDSTPVISRPSPEEVISNYYSNINQRQYLTSWNILSLTSQNNKATHPKGYGSFLEWWTQVNGVDVESSSAIASNPETATVDADLRYSMKSGKSIVQSLRFFLLWDDASSEWKIDRVERLSLKRS